MTYTISLFERELGDGGGGQLIRHQLDDSQPLREQLEDLLRSVAAWSPILWKDDVRKADHFESASLVAVDWEVTHDDEFPRSLYEDPARFSEFIASLRVGDVALPDFVHATKHGVRLIWLLDQEITTADEYQELMQCLALDYGGDIAATNLAVGFTSGRHLQHSHVVEIHQDVETD